MDSTQITWNWSFYRCKKAYKNIPKFTMKNDDEIIEAIPWFRLFTDVKNNEYTPTSNNFFWKNDKIIF